MGVHEDFFRFQEPVRFFSGFGDGFEEKVIFVGIVFERLLVIDQGVSLASQVLDILDERALVVIKNFKIFLLLQEEGFLELFDQQIELKFYLVFDHSDPFLEFVEHGRPLFHVLQNSRKLAFTQGAFEHFFHGIDVVFDGGGEFVDRLEEGLDGVFVVGVVMGMHVVGEAV